MRLRWFLLSSALFACGPDAEPQDCVGAAMPDFDVLITAEYGPLPPDTVLRLHYGGRDADDPEELDLADPKTPEALFCYVSDRMGQYPKGEPALGSGPPPAVGGAAGDSGAGGEPAAGEPPETIEALYCRIWTDGSAELDVITQTYGKVSVELETKRSGCTVEKVIPLMPVDGGV
jgi:hypothetical protein